MSLATALLTPILGDASPWGPQRLFQLGEAGAWYDPSDLTAEKVAWRRNLLTWSEDFTNAAWTKTDTTITANSIAAPDGTLTADLATEGTAGNARTGSATVTLPASTTVAASFFLKRGNTDWVRIFVSYAAFGSANGAGAWFNLATGQKGTTAALGDADQVSSVIADAGNGWYRCTLISRSISTANVLASVNSASADGSAVRVNNATFYPWGAQLERSSTATAYQRITDFTSDFLAAFPTHALYQDSAGTTPVTALGQPVGLAIDKSRGGLANLGPELVNIAALPTPSIDNAGGSNGTWTAGTRTIANTVLGTLNSYPRFRFDFGLTANARYIVRGRLSGNLTAIDTIRLAGGGTSNSIGYSSATGRFFGVQASAVSYMEILMNGTLAVPQSVVVEELSIREVPGVHAIQPSSASRPLLDGRVNLLTFSEQYSDASWTKTGGAITANTTVAPDGTTTGDTFTAAAGTSVVTVIPASITVATTAYAQSIHARAGTYRYLWLGDRGDSIVRSATFDLQTGTILGSFNVTSATVTNAGNGWYKCDIMYTRATAGPASHVVALGEATPAVDRPSRTWAGTESVVLWGSDLRLATDAAYPYQRVAAATDYADVGVPRSFAFDGFDDSLYTASNMDLSGIDKVTVLAGVRKLSDAAAGMLAETSADVSANNGAFYLLWPRSGSLNGVQSASKGTVASVANSGNTYAAPATRVLAVLADISGDALSNRINGVMDGTSTTDQGTGNYGSYVLFIGRRNNANLPFNGKAYQLIVRGALTDTATLAQAERYVGAKTGIFL